MWKILYRMAVARLLYPTHIGHLENKSDSYYISLSNIFIIVEVAKVAIFLVVLTILSSQRTQSWLPRDTWRGCSRILSHTGYVFLFYFFFSDAMRSRTLECSSSLIVVVIVASVCPCTGGRERRNELHIEYVRDARRGWAPPVHACRIPKGATTSPLRLFG